MNSYIYLVLAMIILSYALIKSHIERKKLSENLIPYERIRTVLYLSKIKKRPLWIVICASNATYNESQVISGVIDGIINGSSDDERSQHRTLIGGQFTIHNNPTRFNMSDIRGVSLTSIQSYKDIKGPLNLDYDENTLNYLEHFTGQSTKELVPSELGLSSGPFDDHYYKVIARF